MAAYTANKEGNAIAEKPPRDAILAPIPPIADATAGLPMPVNTLPKLVN